MKNFNLSGFKKVSEDDRSATMIHKDGHQIVVAKTALKPIQLKQLEKLPMHMFRAGMVDSYESKDQNNPNPEPTSQSVWARDSDQGGSPPVPQGVPAPNFGTQGRAADEFAITPQQREIAQKNFEAGRGAAPPPMVLSENASSDMQPSSESPASQQQGPATAQSQQIGPDLNQGYSDQISAIRSSAKAEGNQGIQTAQAIDKLNQEMAARPTSQQIMEKYSAADDAFKQYINTHDVDPNHYWADKRTGQKIASGIGLFLGGFGSAFTGQANPALGIINNAIEKDIDAQKSNLDKKKTLWGMNREAMKDELSADLATRNQAYAALQNQILKIAAVNTDPIARARAEQLVAGIKKDQYANNFRRALMSGPTGDSADPATRVPYLVPKEHQAKVFDEIEAAQNAVHHGPAILKAFDDAAQKIHVMDFIPGTENADQKAFHTLLGPTFKDVEGTVRQAAMDNVFHNTTPQFGDNARTIGIKRKSVEQYLSTKTSAPTAKGYGIDLSKFPSTDIKGALPGAAIKGADGKMYVQQGNFMVPVK